MNLEEIDYCETLENIFYKKKKSLIPQQYNTLWENLVLIFFFMYFQSLYISFKEFINNNLLSGKCAFTTPQTIIKKNIQLAYGNHTFKNKQKTLKFSFYL